MVWGVVAAVGAVVVFLVATARSTTGDGAAAKGGGFTLGNFDKHVTDFAEGVAEAEGYYVAGSVPQRAHNPGDLGPGDTGVDAVIHAVGSDVSVLAPDNGDAQGWNFLYEKLDRVMRGASAVYSPSMTFNEFAEKYVGTRGDWVDEAQHIVDHLVGAGYAVDVNTTLREYMVL